jgi:hypothetical protein
MNLAEARIVLRPRFRLESIDLGFRYVFGQARRPMAVLALLTLLPAFLVTSSVRWALQWSWWSVWVIALTLGSLASGVFTMAAGRLLFERTVAVRGLLIAFARRLPTYMAALFTARLLTLLGASLVIPGLFAWIRYSYVAEAVLLEQVPVRRALSRSGWLSRSGSDDVLGTIAALVLVSFVIVLGVERIGISIVEDVLAIPLPSSDLLSDGGSYFALAGYFISVPWAATSRFLSYIDGRTRQDGWDVQVRLMALEATGTA